MAVYLYNHIYAKCGRRYFTFLRKSVLAPCVIPADVLILRAMNRFESEGLSEGERQQRAAVGLTWRVNEILSAHPRTMNMDIRDVIEAQPTTLEQRHDELIRMSANNHLKCLAAFYKRLYPDISAVRVVKGTHDALPLYDTMTSSNVMLLATTLSLPDNRSMGAVTVTVRDEYILSGSTIYLNDDGRFEAYNDIKPRNDELVIEALELVGVGRRDLVVPVLSGVISEDELVQYITELRPVVAERYNDTEAERFLTAIQERYHEKVNSRQTADLLGLSLMTSNEMEDLIRILQPAETWN